MPFIAYVVAVAALKREVLLLLNVYYAERQPQTAHRLTRKHQRRHWSKSKKHARIHHTWI